MNNIIEDINNIYNQLDNHSEDYIISEINDYINNIKDIDKLELINNLKEDNRLILNKERNKYILDYVKNLIKNKITCYNKYVKLSKLIIENKILENNELNFEDYIKIFNIKDNEKDLLEIQYNKLIKSPIIPFSNDLIFKNNLEDELIKRDYLNYNENKTLRRYKLIQTIILDKNTFLISSYLCYFKSAINFIINHPFFLYLSNLSTDSTNIIPENIPQLELKTKFINGGIYHPYEHKILGGNELWNLLINDKLKLKKILNLFLSTFNYGYTIGIPGFKYYPYIILQHLLNILDNRFSNIFIIKYTQDILTDTEKFINKTYGIENFKEINKYYYLFNSNYNIFINPPNIKYNKNTFNKDYIFDNYLNTHITDNFNNSAIIISTIQNDPLVFNTFNNIVNYKLSFDDILLKTKNNIKFIKDNDIFYNYYYKININKTDYYLQSFIVIEYISKINMCFHCVYIKLEYNYDINGILYIKNKIRYDDLKLNYNYKKNLNDIPFLNEELGLFKDDKINDLYFTKYNEKTKKIDEYYYKICLVSYCKADLLF